MKHGLSGYKNNKCRCDICKAAKRASARAYYLANREACIGRERAYRAANQGKVTERHRRYRDAHRDELAERNRRYYKANRVRITKQSRDYYEANREKVTERNQRYRNANRGRITDRNRRYRAVKGAHGIDRHASLQSATEAAAGRKYGRWTASEDAVALDPDLTVVEIAFILKRTYNSVVSRRRNLRKAQHPNMSEV